jgi:hypothetical protein
MAETVNSRQEINSSDFMVLVLLSSLSRTVDNTTVADYTRFPFGTQLKIAASGKTCTILGEFWT